MVAAVQLRVVALALVPRSAVWMVAAEVLGRRLGRAHFSPKINSRSRRPHSYSWYTLTILVHCYHLGILHDREVGISHTRRITAKQQRCLHCSVESEH